MMTIEEFRTGSHSIPFSCAHEVFPCCWNCVYLLHEESTVCFCDAPFYYYCGYNWPDKLNTTIPPCLS